MQRLKIECLDLFELVLLPGLAAILPWSLCFKAFKRMARWQWLYREPCEEALVQARRRGWAGQDVVHWLWVRKLVTLVDHADHYLGLTRSDRWMSRNITIDGNWLPSGQAQLLVTFHWGAGYWGLRNAAAHGLRPHALVASLHSQAYVGRWVLTRYAQARNRNVAKTLGAENIDVATDLKSVVRAVRQREALLGVVDVPADGVKAAIQIHLLGMQASVPKGLLRLAIDHQLPTTLYITGLDTQTGRRSLCIQPLNNSSGIDSLANQVFTQLERVIASDAPAWHFWGIADRFFK